jgi:hypothetical protein
VPNTSYFPSIDIDGKIYEFSHLNAFKMSFESVSANKNLNLHVVFTNHCFTTSYVAGSPTNGMPLFDINTPRPRIFCPTRYALSKELPRIIREMNHQKVKVQQTRSRRNFVHSIKIHDPNGPYHLFIDVQKGSKEDAKSHDLKIVVESAYHEDDKPPVTLGTIGFYVLCANKYLGKKVATRR